MGIVGLLVWIIVGGVAGWLASKVMKTSRKQGLMMDVVVGIVGAFIGGFVFNALGIGGAPTDGVLGFNIGSLVVAFVGAVIFLGLLRFLNK